MLFAVGVNGVTAYFAQTGVNSTCPAASTWTGGSGRSCFIAPDVHHLVLPRRVGGEVPRLLPGRRDHRADDLLVRGPRPGRRAGRVRLGGAQPGIALRRRRGDRRCRRGVLERRRRGRGRRLLRRVLVVGRLRDGAELRRGGPQPEEDDGVRHLHLGDRPRPHVHVLVVDADQRVRRFRRPVAVGGHGPVRDRPGERARERGLPERRLREHLLPGRRRTSRGSGSRTSSRSSSSRARSRARSRSGTRRTGTCSRWAARGSCRGSSAGRTRPTRARSSPRSSCSYSARR